MPITPNMNLDLPTPSVTTGPEWADDVNEAFNTVDTHDHTPGNGVPIPASGLNIDDDLAMNENSLIEATSVGFDTQVAALGPSVVHSVYDVNGDLFFNNGAGTPVQITVGSAVNVSSTALVPAGVFWPYGGTSAPSGFLLCDGAAVSRSTYSALFLAIGTVYGAGNGTTTFNIPNMNGRTPVGAGTYTDPVLGSTTRTLGASAGEASHVQTQAEMSAHSHGLGNHSHKMLQDAVNGGVTYPTAATSPAKSRSAGDSLDYQMVSDVSYTNPTLGQTSLAVGSTDNAGAGNAATIMQPYLVCNFIIKY